MALNKNNYSNLDRNIFTDEGQRDQNLMFKNSDTGEYYIYDHWNNTTYVLEVKAFLDKNGNGGCLQRKVYFSNRDTYQRTGRVNNKNVQWSGWVLMLDADDIYPRDARMNNIDGAIGQQQRNYNDAVNKYNDNNNRMNQLSNDISNCWNRANDAWNRTADIYGWAIRDIRLAGYQIIPVGQGGEANGYVNTGLFYSGGGLVIQRRVLQKLVNGNWHNSYFA